MYKAVQQGNVLPFWPEAFKLTGADAEVVKILTYLEKRVRPARRNFLAGRTLNEGLGVGV